MNNSNDSIVDFGNNEGVTVVSTAPVFVSGHLWRTAWAWSNLRMGLTVEKCCPAEPSWQSCECRKRSSTGCSTYNYLFCVCNACFCSVVGRGGEVVRSGPCDRRVAGSNPSLAVGTLGKSFTRNCLWRFGVLTPTRCHCCSLERLCVVVDLERRYRNTRLNK